ncbi:hypothetical protein [Crystallibacter degradans]|uniref:hypothetical protein n=1 Tax=Crystallibacter degradans TaxID=2726743 RepID=UPI0014733F84|nr:hypothetical protein [Arthrobacter sp. SF27]NMR29157.1 hypothetical protein [Arthrobacter sp. SF27]
MPVIEGTLAHRRSTPPGWAVQRVAGALETEQQAGRRTNTIDLARRTGLSKGLARRCLNHLQTMSAAVNPR